MTAQTHWHYTVVTATADPYLWNDTIYSHTDTEICIYNMITTASTGETDQKHAFSIDLVSI